MAYYALIIEIFDGYRVTTHDYCLSTTAGCYSALEDARALVAPLHNAGFIWTTWVDANGGRGAYPLPPIPVDLVTGVELGPLGWDRSKLDVEHQQRLDLKESLGGDPYATFRRRMVNEANSKLSRAKH